MSKYIINKIQILILLFIFSLPINAQKIQKEIEEIESKVIKWRRQIHQNPELSNREF